ncbi:unnamed protein product [Sphenostylis stenocarpa]|uniref:Uncharacterized protein n=1 Tax=Sphenostylis stenocarpa TaxID=92480 RepID=A0AA86W1W8_9FABA|nr:unnamed protein product [Sphenostylis stenocarpa]
MATIISAWRMVGAQKQLHDNLCMAISGGKGGPCGCAPVWSPINMDPWFAIHWIFANDHQLRCDLVPPTPCLISCRRNTPDLRLYLRGTVKFAVSLSHKELRSYLLPHVWFICCLPWL